MKNGTALASAGLLLDLAGAMPRQLPRQIEKEKALWWLNNQDVLKAALYELLVLGDGSRWPMTECRWVFHLDVNYRLGVEELIEQGAYDYADRGVAELPWIQRVDRVIEFHLLSFHDQHDCTLEQLLDRLHRQGLRPAELKELLTFGAKYPDLQKYYYIPALGSRRVNERGDTLIPVLTQDQRPRVLRYNRWTNGRGALLKIAAVPKS